MTHNLKRWVRRLLPFLAAAGIGIVTSGEALAYDDWYGYGWYPRYS